MDHNQNNPNAPNGGLPPPNRRRRFPFNVFRRRPRGPPANPADDGAPVGWVRHRIQHAVLRLRGYRDVVQTDDIFQFLNPEARHRAAEDEQTTIDARLWAIHFTYSPHVVDSANGSAPDDEAEMCAVCVDNLQGGDLGRSLPCGHTFHLGCIDPWIRRDNNDCPVCRRQFFPL